MAIPQGFIDDLLKRVDVVEVVGRHVQLKRAGANYQGLCPFHNEKSPSFTVSASKQFFHCFGCGKNGNAIGFLMEHTGSGFIETVKDLAQQVGMSVPQDNVSPQELARQKAQRERRKTLTDVLEQAGQAYIERLKHTPLAVDYLKQRGLSGHVAKRYGLGYAADTWRGLASVFAAYDDPLLEQSGLVIHNEEEDKRYDRFRGRIMFPIRNQQGECIGFGGRVLGDAKPKYLNSPETPVFSKGHELYGLFEARTAIRDAGYVLVTEGYMDVVALAQLGLPHAVATLGTACTPDHLHKLFRVTDQIVFSFDGDAAGRRAAHKALRVALPMATDVRTIKFLFLPAEHDPDSFVRAHGKEAFEQAVKQAVPLSRFVLDAASEDKDLGTAEGRAQSAAQAAELWANMPAGTLQQQVLADLADLVRMPAAQLMASWQASGVLQKALQQKGSMQQSPPNFRREFGHTPSQPAPPIFPALPTHAGSPSEALDAPAWTEDGFPPLGHDMGLDGYADFGASPWPDMPPNASAWPPPTHAPNGSTTGYPQSPQGAPNRYGSAKGQGKSFGKFGKRPHGDGQRNWSPQGNPSPTQVAGQLSLPTPRAEHAARLLLAQMSLWEQLSADEHSLLCKQPDPIGPLLSWLDRQFHEQGCVSWGTLSESLPKQPFAPFAKTLMARHTDLSAPQSTQEMAGELRSIMLGLSHEHYAELSRRCAANNDLDGLRRASEHLKRIATERASLREAE